MAKTEPTGRTIITQKHSSKPEDVIRGLFGMSYEDFIEDVQVNLDGKYDQMLRKIIEEGGN